MMMLTHPLSASLLQILQNLVTNACKFGGGEKVLLRTSVVPLPAGSAGENAAMILTRRLSDAAAAGAGAREVAAAPSVRPQQQRIVLSVSVHNKGPGMSTEDLNSCFEAYKHTSAAAGGGSGLGLYISRAFALLLGGTLSAASEGGETVFTLSVPLRVPTPEEVTHFREAASLLMDSSAAEFPRMGASDVRNASATRFTVPVPEDHEPALRILVADDHALNLNLVSRLLGKSGFVVVPVKDGKEALEALIASFNEDSPGSSFHCAVLDMQMPVMTGVECAHAFRQWESESGNGARWGKLPLVALTANVLEEHVSQCFDSGMVRPVASPALGVSSDPASDAANRRTSSSPSRCETRPSTRCAAWPRSAACSPRWSGRWRTRWRSRSARIPAGRQGTSRDR